MIGASGGRVSSQRREGVWPRVYRLRRGQRWLFGVLGGLAAVGGLVAIGAALLRAPAGAEWLALVGLLFAGLGGLLLRALQVGRLRLFEDAVEITELGKGRRRLRNDEIAGRRLVPLQYGQVQLVLVLRGQDRKPVKVGWAFESDAVLDAWLASIPDLDAAERARAEAELLASAALGRSVEERRGALDRARKLARALTVLGVAACAWGWFYPRPYRAAAATLAALPLVALALLALGRGRYSADPRRSDPRPSLAVPLAGPGLILALRAVADLNVLDLRPLLVGAALGAAGLAALVALGDRALRKVWLVALWALLLAAHTGGSLALANALLDGGEEQVFPVAVLGKHVTAGKNRSYDLRLPPWGPVTEPGSVSVSRGLYRAVEVGDTVCVRLRPGALGIRWYLVTACER